jgi:hypothetical protein
MTANRIGSRIRETTEGAPSMRALLAAIACTALFASAAQGQEVKITANDTTQSIIGAQKSKRVTVRLRGGQELTGVVRDANAKLVVLGAVSGREFFDAVVPLEAVEAVLIRTKQ